MISMGGFEIPLKALRQQFAAAVDLVLQVNRLQGGPRRVTAITEVLNLEQDTVVMQDIFVYVQDGIGEDGRAFGHFEATGVRPSFMGRLESAGVRLPANLFGHRNLGRC
jgi:pilus assembly protein CpaF